MKERCEQSVKIAQNLTQKFVDFGRLLSEIKEEKNFEPDYSSWKEFVAVELKISTDIAALFIKISNYFCGTLGLTDEDIQKLGIAKCKALLELKHADEDDAIAYIEEAFDKDYTWRKIFDDMEFRKIERARNKENPLKDLIKAYFTGICTDSGLSRDQITLILFSAITDPKKSPISGWEDVFASFLKKWGSIDDFVASFSQEDKDQLLCGSQLMIPGGENEEEPEEI